MSKFSTTVLFEEGEWEIHDNPLQHLRLNPAVSRVVHYCGADFCHVWASLGENLICPACDSLMPDSVWTLWTLQNFDVDFGNSRRTYRDEAMEVMRTATGV